MLRAIGPSVESMSIHTSLLKTCGTRPCVGRKPKQWFQPAGLRSEPMKSEPSATGSMRCARLTAAPPLLPPALTCVSHALCVAPHSVLKVCEPNPSSGDVVRPITMQPASLMRATIRLSVREMWFASSSQPRVVAKPATSVASLIAIGRPCSQPRDRPEASSLSYASACASSVSSGARLTMALKLGLTCLIRARKACITSRQDTSFAWILRDSVLASRSVRCMNALFHSDTAEPSLSSLC